MDYIKILVAVAIVIILALMASIVITEEPQERAEPPPRGALDTHAWEAEVEQIETQVAAFIETLEHPAEPTYVTEYKMMAIQVVESTPGGDINWSLTFILTEDGWVLMGAMQAE